jgi:UDP-N-acetylglucosamine 2-epimerase (non-hydrolysing)
MTMPEEINRICTDAIADLLFTTDKIAGENLRGEGVAKERICFVGNTMIDTLLRHLERARSLSPPAGIAHGDFALLTLHRPSNVDNCEVLTGILSAVIDIAQRIQIVFPAHPRTVGRLKEFGLLDRIESQTTLRFIDPVSYLPFLGMLMRCRMVLTDSGGIQEETTVLGIPCITMRTSTERPITCELGTNVLVGTDPTRIREAALAVLSENSRKHSIPEKWDGHAATRIVEVLLNYEPLMRRSA